MNFVKKGKLAEQSPEIVGININRSFNLKNLSCNNCGKRVDIFEIFNVKPNEIYYCKKCNEPLEPVFHPLALKTWDKTPFIGLMTVIIPIYTINFFLNDRWTSYVIGAIIAILLYLGYLIFLVKTTKFK